MRLRSKLLLAFLVPSLFPLLPSVFATAQLRDVGEDVKGLERTTLIEDLRTQVHLEIDQLPGPDALSADRPQRDEEPSTLFHGDRARLLCRSLAKQLSTPEGIAAVTTLEALLERYVNSMRAFVAAPKAGRAPIGEEVQATYDVLQKSLSPEQGKILEPVAEEAHEAVARVADRSERRARRALLTIALGLGAALSLTFFTAVVLARVTARPILSLVLATRRVARGDLELEVKVRGEDETAELAAGFNEMVHKIRHFTGGLEGLVRERTEELRRREVDLERARKLAAVGRLAAGVAHEVANPLAVIAASAEGLGDRIKENPTLAKTPGLEDFPPYLDHIEREAFRLKKLVRRLLDFARPDKDDEGISMHDMDLVEVAREAASLVALDPRAKTTPIDAKPLEGVTLGILGDSDRLKEVILNLLFNALDATKASGGKVTVSARRDGEVGVVAVSDTGEGIAPADLERLFEPFFTTKPPGEGTGLGLALSYGIAERHGGTLLAKSDGKGKGATFELRIPLKPEPKKIKTTRIEKT